MNANLSKQGGKFVVVLPAPITIDGTEHKAGPVTFDKADPAWDFAGKVNAAYEALTTANARIEILSKDGQPIHGFQTVKATDRTVYKTSKAKGNKPAGTPVTEIDICEIAGYVLARRNGSGNVMSDFVPGPDFSRYQPVSADGLAAILALHKTQQ